MEEELAALLGGRVAESLFLSDISTGASNDLQRASGMARKMVMTYGMSEKLGPVSFDSGHDEVFIGRSMAQAKAYSEEVAARIDGEVKAIIDAAYHRCEAVLERHREKLESVAAYLLAHETMGRRLRLLDKKYAARQRAAYFVKQQRGHGCCAM